MLDEVVHILFVPEHSMMHSDRDLGLGITEKRKRATLYLYTHHNWFDLILIPFVVWRLQ